MIGMGLVLLFLSASLVIQHVKLVPQYCCFCRDPRPNSNPIRCFYFVFASRGRAECHKDNELVSVVLWACRNPAEDYLGPNIAIEARPRLTQQQGRSGGTT